MPGVKAEYTYKSDGLRISKNVNGDIANHIWDGLHLLVDTDDGYEEFDTYYRGIDLIYSDAGGYYVYNAHGDVVQLADTEGEIVKEYSFDAFGVEKDIDEADENPFRYCGEYYDKETGTIYLRARYYVPRTGRFMSEDGIRDGLNWYTYCTGNPIRYIDPTGHYFIVADREFDYIGAGEYRLGELKGTYSVVSMELIVALARGAAGFLPIPILSGYLSKNISSSNIYGDIVGGSSYSDKFSLNLFDLADVASKTEFAKDNLPNVLDLYNMVSKGMATFDALTELMSYEYDLTLFALMDMYNIPLAGYTSLDAVTEQMGLLEHVISGNPDYFGTYATGHDKAQFMTDYQLYQMSESERRSYFLEGYSIKSGYWGDSVYESKNNMYQNRINTLFSWKDTYWGGAK